MYRSVTPVCTWSLWSNQAPWEHESMSFVTDEILLFRREMLTLWKAFDLAKAFQSRVDARLLFQNPLLRDDVRYRRYVCMYAGRHKDIVFNTDLL